MSFHTSFSKILDSHYFGSSTLSFSEILESHYLGCVWILFWCTGIVVSGHLPSAALEKQKFLAAIGFFLL